MAIVLSIGRFTIRYVTAGRFHWDDASHLLSILLLIGLAAAYTVGYPLSARIARISMKKEKPPPPTDPFYHKYLQLRLTVTLLVFMVLWSVKATFLIFYRLLFSVNQTFLRLWWGAVALTFASFWVCIGSTFTLCGAASDLYDFSMDPFHSDGNLPVFIGALYSRWLTVILSVRKMLLAAVIAQHSRDLQVLVCAECRLRSHW